MVSVFLKGFAAGGSLIAAIGAQNAFILSQGIKKNRIVLIPLICCICDLIFITLGIYWSSKIVSTSVILEKTIALCGCCFLFFYGLNSFISAFKNKKIDMEFEKEKSIKKIILATLGVTLLNPHFYLDTVFLLGSISSSVGSSGKIFFGTGAVTASIIWFFGLSLFASFLSPVFKNEKSWKILDVSVGIIMWSIAFSLFFSTFLKT
ncbi:MAG: LysE family transporter [Desulforegulaceae bacterium]|nr:LysE family transporter [Desulforegulaceae bacterium]